MIKFLSALVAAVFACSLSFGAMAADDSYKAARKQANDEYKAAKKECDKLKGKEEKACESQAKAKRDKTIADAKAMSKGGK